jgi:hypothetical protein
VRTKGAILLLFPPAVALPPARSTLNSSALTPAAVSTRARALTQVLERTSVLVTPEGVEARFTVALPAAGRSILGQKAAHILTEALPGSPPPSYGETITPRYERTNAACWSFI